MRFFFFAVCRVPNRAPVRVFFFCGLSSRARNRAPAHQIVLHRVLFFTACRASDRAPMHQIVLQCVLFFFRGFVVHQIMLQCVFFFFPRFVVHQIVLYGLNNVESPCSCYYFIRALNMEKKCGKTKNWRFCIVFLFGAWARIWPEPGQPPKPRRILNAEY